MKCDDASGKTTGADSFHDISAEKTQETVEVLVFKVGLRGSERSKPLSKQSFTPAPSFAPEFHGPRTIAKQGNWNLNAPTVCPNSTNGVSHGQSESCQQRASTELARNAKTCPQISSERET